MTVLVLLQMIVVVIGTDWCLALFGTICFIGWYARTHPALEDEQVMVRLAYLLRFFTFGLTACPFPQSCYQEEKTDAS